MLIILFVDFHVDEKRGDLCNVRDDSSHKISKFFIFLNLLIIVAKKVCSEAND